MTVILTVWLNKSHTTSDITKCYAAKKENKVKYNTYFVTKLLLISKVVNIGSFIIELTFKI
jgi:uncharacterized Fe-S cluster-containing MiaB family protein